MPQNNLAFDFDGVYTFYTTKQPDDENVDFLKNGNIFEVSCDSKVACQTKDKLENIVGQSVCFDATWQQYKDICKTLGKILFEYQVEQICVTEGFCQLIDDWVVVKGKKVNFQVAYDGNRVVVGTPTILSGF